MAVHVERTLGRTVAPAAEGTKTQPVVYWAVLGAVTLAFIAFVWGKWVLGPNFESVDYGPSEPPTWMKVSLIGWQVVIPPIALYLVWRFVIRPWRQERHVPFDGLMIVCFALMWFWDPISSFGGHWFTYNAYLLNMGSWTSDFPGFAAHGEPGKMLPEPILLDAPIYMTGFMLGTVIGSRVMKKAKARWPHFGPGRLIGICFLSMMVFDFVIEGLIWIPSGYYTYSGGHLSLWPDTYHKFPLHEVIFAGALWTGFAALHYFRNDKGETLSERGVSQLNMSEAKKTVVRFLALLASMSVVFMATFNIPIAMLIAPHSAPWPKEVHERTYFNDHLCGADTDRLCPGPGVPNARGNDTAYINRDGRLVTPEGVTLPGPVAIEKTEGPHPYSGRLLGSTGP